MKPRLVGVNHVALQVDDLEEAVAFYTSLFEPTGVDRSERTPRSSRSATSSSRCSSEARAKKRPLWPRRRRQAGGAERARAGRRRDPSGTAARLPRSERQPGSGRPVRPDPVHQDRPYPPPDRDQAGEDGSRTRRVARERPRRLARSTNPFGGRGIDGRPFGQHHPAVPTRILVFAAVAALLAGCNGGTVDRHALTNDAATIDSMACEGALLAHNVAHGKTTGTTPASRPRSSRSSPRTSPTRSPSAALAAIEQKVRAKAKDRAQARGRPAAPARPSLGPHAAAASRRS